MLISDARGADNEAMLGSRQRRACPVLTEATMMTKKLTHACVSVAEAIIMSMRLTRK